MTSAVARCCPASSTATPTWSSPATGRPSSRPGWRRAVHRWWDRDDGPRRLGRRPTRSCAAGWRRLVAEMRAAGHDHGRGQERVRPDRRATRPGPCGWPARSRPRRRTWVRTSCRRSTPADRDDYVALVAGEMLDGLRAVRPVGRRLLRAGAARLRRRRGPDRPDRGHGGRAARAAAARQPAHRRPRACGWASSSGAASVDHCTHLAAADVEALAGSGAAVRAGERRHRRDPAARRGVLHPLAVPGRSPAARRRSGGRAGDRLQPRLVLLLLDAAVHRAGRPGDADDAGRGGLVGDGGRRDGVAPQRHRAAVTRSAVPTSPSSTRPATVHLAYRPGVPIASTLELG